MALVEHETRIGCADLAAPALARLREKQVELAEVIDSDRALAAMRQARVIGFEDGKAALQLRRERVRAAEARWGHQLRGNGDQHA